MRNSISVALVIIAITIAFGSTLLGGLAQANAANGFVTSGGNAGLLIALILGLVGAGIKPRTETLSEDMLQAKWALACATTVVAEEAAVETITVELPVVMVEQPVAIIVDTATLTALADTLEAILVASLPMPRTIGEMEASLTARGITNFLPPVGESLLSRRAHTAKFLPSCFV